MPRFGLSRLRDRPAVSALIALVVLLALWWAASSVYEQRLLAEERAGALNNLPVYGNSLTEEFEQYSAVLTMLRTLISLDDTANSPEFATIAAEAVAGIEGVRSIWVAPGGTVSSVYPHSGNETLLGLNLLEDERPGIRQDVAAAIESRRISLSDQADQLEETQDWIAWVAVYSGEGLWGILALQLDSTHLLHSLNPEDPRRGLLLAMRDDAGRVIFGPKTVFEDAPVIYRMDRLESGWTLGAVPVGGWLSSVRGHLQLFEFGGLAVMALLVGLVYVNARHQAAENARRLAAAQDAAITEERQRLAAELHDSVTQLIFSDVLLAEASRQVLASGDSAAADQYLGRIGETAQQALKEMRLLLFELRHSGVDDDGLLGALQRRLDAVEKRAGVAAQLLADADLRLPSVIEEGLFRVASEALNNALKHAAATSVAVELRAEGDLVEMTVSDNGRGFDPRSAARSGGLGFTTMRERVDRLGGCLMVESEPGAGSTVRVKVQRVPGTTAGRPENGLVA